MRKDGFTVIEVVIVFLLLLCVTFLVLPKSLDTTKQARFISKWSQKYSELVYMRSVIKAQQDEELNQKFDGAADNDERKEILLETIKPYLRIVSKMSNPKYIQHYMSGEKIPKSGLYHFDEFYKTAFDEVLGLKWLKEDCKEKEVCAIMVFDINGEVKPNKWGYDIFGVNILKNQIEPIGKGVDSELLKADCSNRGFGTYCSYYYLIGGKFD